MGPCTFTALSLIHIWLDLRGGGTLETFLESLMRHCATGLLALPGFAVALVRPGSAHVAVRHQFGVDVTSAAGEQQLAGGAVSTWAEITVRQVTALTLRCGDVADPVSYTHLDVYKRQPPTPPPPALWCPWWCCLLYTSRCV